MTTQLFVDKNYMHAKTCEARTSVPALLTLGQAAFESGWGRYCPGNMYFGIKDTDGVNGNEQLVTTTEYHTTIDVQYPQVISITPVVLSGKKLFKYKVKAYFRKYATPADSFTDHANFLLRNPRYQKAMTFKDDPYRMADEIAKAGYASDPNYAETLKAVMRRIEKYLPKS